MTPAKLLDNPRISIHAPREGCDSEFRVLVRFFDISIHAPREGCDTGVHYKSSHADISIHAPREGCDGICLIEITSIMEFQSTHPVRGATFSALRRCDADKYFNPRTP